MTFIDLFAGIGGFRRGMEMAGHKCLGFCEYDKFAVASYTAMHLMTDEDREYIKTLPFNKRLKEALKEEYRHGEWYSSDIRRLRADDIPRADVWCFGFPCQDISVAGKQLGFRGDRSSLFFTVMRLIQDTAEEDRPSMLFIENVKNLLSINRGADFLKVLIALDEAGYDAEWQVINSADYVPQNRERVFIIGHLRGRGGRKVFPVESADRKNSVSIIGHRDGYRRNSQTYSPEGITEALDTGTGGGRNFNVVQPINTIGGNARTIKAQYYKCGTANLKRADGYGVTGVAVPVLTPDREHKRQNGRRMKEDGEPMFSLTAQDRHGIYDGFRIRKLTPKECFRLQGWEDTYFERAALVSSDSQLYKQAGNGVTVPVIYEIARRF